MPEELKPDPKEATTQDAQLAAERMASGEEKAPAVDVEGDYEASKQFDVSDVDRSGAGAQAAEAATSSKFKTSESSSTAGSDVSSGNPEDYREMAKEVNPRAKQ